MLGRLLRHSIRAHDVYAIRKTVPHRREFSIISVHATVPATLYRFQAQRISTLLGYKADGDAEDGV